MLQGHGCLGPFLHPQRRLVLSTCCEVCTCVLGTSMWAKLVRLNTLLLYPAPRLGIRISAISYNQSLLKLLVS